MDTNNVSMFGKNKGLPAFYPKKPIRESP